MPTLAIVIVNYNTRQLLAECLRSVYESETDCRYHVVVVDNRSTDASVELVESNYPQATLIESDRNGGFGYANNLALRWLSRLDDLPEQSAGRLEERGPLPGQQPASEIPSIGSA